MNDRPRARFRRLAPLTLVLSGVVAGLAGSELLRPAAALAQPSREPSDVLNAGEQRRRILEAIQQTNDRLSRIEARLDKPLTVKVTEMPRDGKDKDK